MKLKITNGELINALIPSLMELVSIKIKTPVKVNYAANKTLSHCDIERKPIDESRKKILETFCETDKDGKPKSENNEYVFLSPERKQDAINNINELFAIEAEIEIHTVPFEMINEIEGKVSGNWINYLEDKFFVHEKPENENLEVIKKP